MPRLRLAVALLPLVLLAVAAPAQAQRGGGLSDFPLLQMEASTRGAAMGGAFSAVPDGDAAALFYHPALPGERTRHALSASYLNHLLDINAGFLAYSRRVDGLGAVSGGLRFFSYGDFEEGRDARGNPTGNGFSAQTTALTLGLARALPQQLQPGTGRVRYGANVHVAYRSIERANATALAADLGVLYHLPAQQFTVSASVNNLGTALDRFHERSLDLPADLRLGVSKELAHLPLRLSMTGFDLQSPGGGSDGASSFDQVMRHLALGAELTPVNVLALRIGYSHRRNQQLRSGDRRVDPAGLSAGFGLSIQRVSVDYAFSSWSAIGGLHQFGLRARL